MNENINPKVAIKKISEQLQNLKSLSENKLFDNRFNEWLTVTRNLIEDLFGRDSRQFREFKSISYQPGIMFLGDPKNDEKQRNAVSMGIKKAQDNLSALIGFINEYWNEEKTDSNRKGKTEMKNLHAFNEKVVWEEIKNEFDYSKNKFGKKINFVKDPFKRKIIFRDIAQSFYLVNMGCYKPGVILAGGVIEELLKYFLELKGFRPQAKTFNEYIKCCEQNGLLKTSISKLSHSIREFRNLVHLNSEENAKYTLSKTTAIGAISSVFTIANDF